MDCNKPDILIFLVGFAQKKSNKTIDRLYRSINLETLTNLMEGLRTQNKLPKRIIFSSTISVYGEKWSVKSYSESDQLTPYCGGATRLHNRRG
jgi:nucleoside-diphosphate-sugar epimerase